MSCSMKTSSYNNLSKDYCEDKLDEDHKLSAEFKDTLAVWIYLYVEELDAKMKVTIRGQPDEDAVLTQSKTYALKYVGTSNSVFLIPPSDKAVKECNEKDDMSIPIASVIKVALGNMELVEKPPILSITQQEFLSTDSRTWV
ncbi:unnamed protein product [Fraxinus pennsylvanica]|uniref:Uncharacterized protein n=1 Tax=Fraxinus pennsylvanica TaxID=56036 RepID=A0AAD2DYD5_9LAMI|nr:unnamed protein product [Fraxinus pennsylvanica]